MLPVGLILSRSLLKKVVVAVIVAAAETVMTAPAKGKVKR
jgi:gas vesicle protein